MTRFRGTLVHVVLGLAVLLSLFPFYWTVVMATNTTRDVFADPPTFIPGTHLIDNVNTVLANVDLLAPLVNTILVASATTALVLFLDTLAAFTFAKYEFPGRRVMFGLLLGLFMVPAQLSLIPQFVIMSELGWVGSLKALVIPAAANAFGIFWMRQYIIGAVPDELLEAARLDGAGFFRIYWSVVLPIVRPGLAFLGIYTFIAAWNDYVWPLIVLLDPNKVTLQVALSQLNVGQRQDYSVLMAGALIGIVPLIAVFTLFARGFVSDATKGAIRG
ncbi:carbohydrate ABC transporter permease [Catenuloplanes japonicus]|uniref:carbohydrate ABC transporter permease n=1 Tax=Catenuloplanes japonicus TaxID=33876 RepID=UPI000AAC33F3|nr:carbohydrate ABC transporter permease [Catenuloplanes japonicus]